MTSKGCLREDGSLDGVVGQSGWTPVAVIGEYYSVALRNVLEDVGCLLVSDEGGADVLIENYPVALGRMVGALGDVISGSNRLVLAVLRVEDLAVRECSEGIECQLRAVLQSHIEFSPDPEAIGRPCEV